MTGSCVHVVCIVIHCCQFIYCLLLSLQIIFIYSFFQAGDMSYAVSGYFFHVIVFSGFCFGLSVSRSKSSSVALSVVWLLCIVYL